MGVIGGLGPETTSEFYLDVIFMCQKQNNESRPGIVISSVPLPYQIEEDAISKNQGFERIKPFLIDEAKRLEKSGADFIVMPCNSLHVFIEDIRKSVSIPVLSIIEETVSYIKKKDYKSVGIVSTSATIKNKLYENAFEKSGIKYLTPNEFEQEKMSKYIYNLVIGQKNNRDRDGLLEIIDNLVAKKVEAVALACTDLQLLIPKHSEVEVFDTMKILAEASVRKILS